MLKLSLLSGADQQQQKKRGEERKKGKGEERREKREKRLEGEEKGKLGIPIIGRKQDNFEEKKRVKLNRKRIPKTFVSGPEILELKKYLK